MGRMTLTTPTWGTVTDWYWYFTSSTRIENLKSLAFAIPEISGGGSKISKMGYVTRITPFSGMMFHQQAGTCYGQLINQIWSLYLHQLWRYEKRWKMKKLGRFGAVTGHSRSSAMSLFDRTHTHSYSTLIKTMNLSCTIFVIKRVICRKSSIFTHPTCIWHPQLNSADIFGVRKLESLGCHVALFAWFYI